MELGGAFRASPENERKAKYYEKVLGCIFKVVEEKIHEWDDTNNNTPKSRQDLVKWWNSQTEDRIASGVYDKVTEYLNSYIIVSYTLLFRQGV